MQTNWESEYLKKIYEKTHGQKPPAQKNTAGEKIPRSRLSLLIISSVIFLMVFSAFLGFTLALFSRFMLFETLLTLIPGEKFLGETNVLVLGVDGEGYVKRSDTIMVAHIDPRNNVAGVVSIPRDTRVEIQGRGLDKINHAFAFGGPELSRKTAEQFLGVEVPYYIVIDIAGLRHLIDEIGGVVIDVEKSMYYIDYSQNLFVDLKAGKQRLSGKDALSYLRYRTDGGDLNRILRQQKFINAFATQLTVRRNVLNSPKIILRLLSYMDTNLNTKQILGLALNMRRIYEFGQIKMFSLQGYDEMLNGVYYMQPDPIKLKKAVSEYLKSTQEAF